MVSGVELIGVVSVLVLGDPGHMGRPCLFIVDKPVFRPSLGLVALEFLDAVDFSSLHGVTTKNMRHKDQKIVTNHC